MGQHFPICIHTYFVLNGDINGEAGVRAIPCGVDEDAPQPDGWYWMYGSLMDDGKGPFKSKLEAVQGAKAWLTECLEGRWLTLK